MFKNRGFTDRLYWMNFKIVWTFIFFCFVLTAFSGKLGITDMSIVSMGVPAALAELGLHTGAVIWKAKVENCRKYKDTKRLEELEVIEL